MVFWYKFHVLCDANYDLPIAFTMTPGNKNDSKLLPPVFKKAKEKYSWFSPELLLADKGYEGRPNADFLRKEGTIAVMPLKKSNAKDGLYDGLFNAEGKPTCMGMVGMEYVTTDEETGHQLWRCPSSGCHLLTEGTKAIRHCDTEFWFDPKDHLQLYHGPAKNGS